MPCFLRYNRIKLLLMNQHKSTIYLRIHENTQGVPRGKRNILRGNSRVKNNKQTLYKHISGNSSSLSYRKVKI